MVFHPKCQCRVLSRDISNPTCFCTDHPTAVLRRDLERQEWRQREALAAMWTVKVMVVETR